MLNNWKRIWDNKQVDISDKNSSEYELFRELKRADGFDVAVGDEDVYYRSFYNEWIHFYEMLTELSTLKINSVYEVGCGSGVNLYMFMNRGIEKVGGLDYSKNLSDNARMITGSDDIKADEAGNLDTDKKYDLVIAESVFQYFESKEYAEVVLKKMLEKSRGIVYLGEIHDADYEEALMNYRRKTIKDYDKKYEGLSKQFYSREWIENIAGDRKVVYTKINNSEYLNGKFLFNCFIIGE